MSQRRGDLLDGLHEARALAGHTEQCVRRILACASLHDEQRLKMDAVLDQTIEQRWLLGQCVRRINDVDEADYEAESDTSITPAGACVADQKGATALHSLHCAMRREVDIYAGLIETAEGTGLFETKWVCERILLKKTTVIEWLAAAGRLETPSRSR
ncbi:hypothetical protein AB4851_12510 [Burkholderia sp. 22PA0099]|uniref:hypothetical protein n=1 Tax=Burkholderia sp. 22PA0099 TaxID=3237372 RepID=UPI0039C023B0